MVNKYHMPTIIIDERTLEIHLYMAPVEALIISQQHNTTPPRYTHSTIIRISGLVIHGGLSKTVEYEYLTCAMDSSLTRS